MCGCECAFERKRESKLGLTRFEGACVRGTERDISLANEPSEIQDPADIFYREENDNSLIYFLLTYLDTYLSYLLVQYELELKNSISKIVQCISSFTTYICLKCG